MTSIVRLRENEPRLPFSLSPFLSDSAAVTLPRRRSFSYYRLPAHPIKLTVLKLDGTSFDVQVSMTASVRELKMAVEGVFGQSLDGIKENISWTHVWGQFCLSYRGLKLIEEKALLKNFGIKDSDQLQFIRHLSVICSPTKNQLRSHTTNAELLRKSQSSDKLVEFEYPEPATENIRNRELTPIINVDASQSPSQQEAIICMEDRLVLKNHSQFKLSHYFKGWLCYSDPMFTSRARSRYKGC